MKINGTGILDFCSALREKWHVPGISIAVSRGGEARFFNSGMASLEEGRAFDEKTLVPIGSITKSLVARAATLCVSEELIRWNVPVSSYVKDLVFADKNLEKRATLADLLSMRTGLAGSDEWTVAAAAGGNESVRALAARLIPLGGFRKTHIYSGFSVALAALVLETVSGKSWTAIVERVMREAGAGPWAFSYDEARQKGFAAEGYFWNEKKFERQPWPGGESSLVDPCGSVCLSSSGLLKWLDAEMSNVQTDVVFKPHILTRYPDVPLDFWPESYGLCWGLRNYRGHPMIYHRGSDWGFRSVVAMVPDADLKIAITSNRNKNLLIHLLLNFLLDAYLAHSFIPWEPVMESYAAQTAQA